MVNERKLEQLRVLIARISRNLKDIENLNMPSLSPLWPDLEAKALAINEDLRIALPLAAQVAPVMVQEITTMKEAVVNMRIDSYNAMTDVNARAVGHPLKDPVVCESMLVRGFKDHYSQLAQDFCISECKHRPRCIASEPPAMGSIS